MNKLKWLIPIWVLFGTPWMHRLMTANIEAAGAAYGSRAEQWAWGLILASFFAGVFTLIFTKMDEL